MFTSWLQMVFYSCLVLSPIISLSTSSWIMLWFSLEINMISFISIVWNKNNLSVNSMIKYFIIQGFASSILFFSMMMLKFNLLSGLGSLMMMLLMCLKLGLSPFHFWFPQVAEGLNWINFFWLSTWQKIIPLYIMSNSFNSAITAIVCMSVLFSVIGMFNQCSLRKILAYSSILHLAWILPSMNNSSSWMLYLMIYASVLLGVVLVLNNYNLSSTYQIYFMKKSELALLCLLLLSMSGLPPFLGFLPKWLIIMNNDSYFMMSTLILGSFCSAYIYLRIVWMNLFKNNLQGSMLSSSKYMNKMFILTNSVPLLFFMPYVL